MRQMKKRLMSLLLALSLCTTLLCVPALAAEQKEGTPAPGALTRMWGQLTRINEKSFSLKNSSQGMAPEVILHVNEDTLYLDAVSGLPVKTDSIKDGQTVYVYTSPAMATSLPPQTTAQLLIVDIPADFAVPSYYTVMKVSTATGGGVQVTTDQGNTITIPTTATFFPYLTKNIVSMANLTPGTRFLVWNDMKGVPNRVMLFAFDPMDAFTDMKEGDSHYDSVKYMVRAALMTGVTDTTFVPAGALSRADAVTILWRMAGSAELIYPDANPYTDVDFDASYGKAVYWAKKNGIMLGFGDNTFAPDRTITREQLAAILYRYEQKLGNGGFQGQWMFLLDVTDRAMIAPSAYEGVAWCFMNKILNGQNGAMNPKAPVTRGQAATMLMRYLTLENKDTVPLPTGTTSAR